MTYVSLILGSLATYYLPTLGALRPGPECGPLIARFWRLVVLVMIPAVTGVIVLKPLIVHLLYSSEFGSALDTLRWMLLGDYFKVATWALALPLVAFARARAYFLIEASWNVTLLVGSLIAIFVTHRPEGIGLAFTIGYVGYFCFVAIDSHRRYRLPELGALLSTWAGGLVLVILASAANWTAQTVNWPAAAAWIAIALVYVWFHVKPDERQALLKLAHGWLRGLAARTR